MDSRQKGQLSLEAVLLLLLALAVTGMFFLFFQRIQGGAQSERYSEVIYPETPPQLLHVQCYTDHGFAMVQADDLTGTLRYRVKTVGGSLIKDGNVSVNFSGTKRVYFGAPMEWDRSYSVEFYVPKWSVSDTCTARVHGDLVLYLPFDEGSGTTAADRSARGNDATLSGTSWTTGTRGNAVEFDGSSSYATVPADTSLDGVPEFTITALIYPRLIAGDVREIAGFSGSTSDRNWEFFIRDTESTLELRITNSTDKELASNGTVVTDSWQFVAGRYEAGELISVTLGRDTWNQTPSFGLTYTPKDLTIGAFSGGTFDWFNGTLDELKIYDRALTDQELDAITAAYE